MLHLAIAFSHSQPSRLIPQHRVTAARRSDLIAKIVSNLPTAPGAKLERERPPKEKLHFVDLTETMRRRRFRCGNAEDFSRTQRDRKTNAPPALPRTRPRALSFPEQSSSARSWNLFRRPVVQQTLDQAQSHLFARLPAEIRDTIWTMTIGGQVLHIARARQRLLAIICTEDVRPGVGTRFHGCWGSSSGRWIELGETPDFYIEPRSNHSARPANLLPLLQTCRRIYQEATVILYSTNVFDFNHIDSLAYLRRSVLPQRLDQIRTLSLTWSFRYSTTSSPAPYDLDTWIASCDLLAQFAGLQEVTMHLKGFAIRPGAGLKHYWEPILGPLTRLRVARRFEIFLPWPEDECFRVETTEKYPFKLLPRVEVPVPINNDPNVEL